jgi:hypothetical protein
MGPVSGGRAWSERGSRGPSPILSDLAICYTRGAVPYSALALSPNVDYNASTCRNMVLRGPSQHGISTGKQGQYVRGFAVAAHASGSSVGTSTGTVRMAFCMTSRQRCQAPGTIDQKLKGFSLRV